MKILYAAQNNLSAKIQLSRFLEKMKDSSHTIKIAAYKNSSPKNVPINWTLNYLSNDDLPRLSSKVTSNLKIYYDQVKYYKPDLIISDMEVFTNHVGNLLNITTWQCSSALLNFGLERNYNLGFYKKFFFLSKKNEDHYIQRQTNFIVNSNKNFIYSHFGDMKLPPDIKKNFEWIRPYHSIGKISKLCHHNLVAGLVKNNKKIITLLRHYNDSVAFTDFLHEKYTNLILKDINNQAEFFCNLKNSNLFICEGQTSFLADAYYNNKHAIIFSDFQDTESAFNGLVSKKYSTGTIVYNITDSLDFLNGKDIIDNPYNNKVPYLHQKIEEIFE